MTSRILLRVTAPAMVTAVILVGASVGSVWSIHRLQVNLARILRESVASVHASLEIETRMRQMRYHSLIYLVRPSSEGLAQIEEDEVHFEEAFERATHSAMLPEEKDYLDQIRHGYARYQAEMARLRAEVARTGLRGDFASLADRHPIRHIVDPCQELGRLNRVQLEETAGESNALSDRWQAVLLFLGIAGPMGGLIAGWGIALGLTRSITRLRVRVRDVMARLEPVESKESLQLTLTADGDLAAMDRQLEEVVHRVEEVMQRLQNQQRDMLRAEQLAALGQLAAGVAHEVRNPLTGMKLLVEAALRPGRPHPLSNEDLHVIQGEIVRLEQTVQHFLDFARPQPLCRRTLDLREVLERPVELVRGRARNQNVHLRLIPGDQPLPVEADAAQLSGVVVNLLINALDALPEGGEVNMIAGRTETECWLRIEDSGPGIDPSVLPRLFTPFASSRPTGTGLGLSVSRRIVEEHGGRIEASNRAEGGACFSVILPRNSRPGQLAEQ